MEVANKNQLNILLTLLYIIHYMHKSSSLAESVFSLSVLRYSRVCGTGLASSIDVTIMILSFR